MSIGIVGIEFMSSIVRTLRPSGTRIGIATMSNRSRCRGAHTTSASRAIWSTLNPHKATTRSARSILLDDPEWVLGISNDREWQPCYAAPVLFLDDGP